MKARWLILSTVCLASCIGNMGLSTMASAENNTYNLWRVTTGLSQAQVARIMHKPYSYESFHFDEDIYDVWFYIVKPTTLGQTRMVAQNLTPLTFKNGVLIHIGYDYYNYLIKEEDTRAKTAAKASSATPPQPSTEPAENIELEKALAPPTDSPSSSPQSQQKKSTQPSTQPTTPQAKPPSTPVKQAPPTNNPNVPSTQPQGKTSPVTPQTKPYQPPNQLPGRPSQPTTPSKPSPSQNQMPGTTPQPQKTSTLSMSKKPEQPKKAPKDPSDPKTPDDEEEAPYGEGGERMEEDEAEQNFNFW